MHITPQSARGRKRTQVRNACIASTPIVPLSCTMCTLISTRPSLLSSPSCGTRVLSDHHNRIVYDHNDAFLARKGRPVTSESERAVKFRNSLSIYLSCLVLGNFVLCVLSAILALAVGAPGLRNVDLRRI
jgi:hypothetical protein